MHSHSMSDFRHEHLFLGADHSRNERKTWTVIVLCGVMMAAEIVGGALFGSMALIADGLHMSTHAGALLIAALAYTYARRHAHDARFTFGTGKLGDLAAFTSAIILAMIALLIAWESIDRLLHPIAIAFNEAIPVAVLGLGVNLVSAWLLRDEHGHHGHDHHGHDHHGHDDHDHHDDDEEHHAHEVPGHHRDLNIRAAYVHVLADAAVSILAIVGLVAGREFGLVWMDPIMGIVGACVIANWSWGLIRAAGATLLDLLPDKSLADKVKTQLERGDDRVADLHLWRVGPGHCAAVVSIVSDAPAPLADYKARLAHLPGLSHVTIEVLACPGHG
jgi:cation diffusion facilitator family transporter